MFHALKECKKSVMWKESVQHYFNNAVDEIHNTIQTILKGELPKFTSVRNIYIRERGKERKITPVTIKDRMVQRVICDNVLIPAIKDSLIFDNGASLSGKGVDFSRNRMLQHLISAKKEYGNNFYVLKFDFKSYFDSIPHSICKRMLDKYVQNEEMVDLIMKIIKSYHHSEIERIKDDHKRELEYEKLERLERNGICLGSQISQILALVVPNEIDHYIKDVKGVKYYIRYMDDGIIISDNKEFLWELLNEITEIANSIGLSFNSKKTHIHKVSNGFSFLKIRYFITDSGKIVKKLDKSSIKRMRTKLKKYRNLVDNGEMTLDNVYASIQSWLAHAEVAHSENAVRNMLKLYDEYFGGYMITAKYYNEVKCGHMLSDVFLEKRKKRKKNKVKHGRKGG